jgi:hypothetical protein
LTEEGCETEMRELNRDVRTGEAKAEPRRAERRKDRDTATDETEKRKWIRDVRSREAKMDP